MGAMEWLGWWEFCWIMQQQQQQQQQHNARGGLWKTNVADLFFQFQIVSNLSSPLHQRLLMKTEPLKFNQNKGSTQVYNLEENYFC